MKSYGYCRISTDKQNLERQIRNIKEVCPEAYIVQEQYTGTKISRPEWDKLLKILQPGDTIYFDSVSRFSRNAEEGFKLYKELYEKDIIIIFLKEPHINTESYKMALGQAAPTVNETGDKATDELLKAIMTALHKFMLSKVEADIYKAFEQSEKEVSDLHQRISEGMLTAKLHGKQIGRIPGKTYETKKYREKKEIIEKHAKAFGGGLSDLEVMKLAGIHSRNTYYRYKKQIQKERELQEELEAETEE